MNQEHVYLWIDANRMHSSQTKSDAITRQDGRMRGMLDGKSKRVRDHELVSDAHLFTPPLLAVDDGQLSYRLPLQMMSVWKKTELWPVSLPRPKDPERFLSIDGCRTGRVWVNVASGMMESDRISHDR